MLRHSHPSPSDGGSTLRTRQDIPEHDRWDLATLFPSDASWEVGFTRYQEKAKGIPSFKGTLGKSARNLALSLVFCRDIGLLEEGLAVYAALRESEDQGDSSSRDRSTRLSMAQTQAQADFSYFEPEVQAIPDATIEDFLAAPELAEFSVWLRKLLRFRPHILTEAEERLLALHMETNQTASNAFSVLTDVDFDFGSIETPEGEKSLSHGSFVTYLQHPNRELRQRAYSSYYAVYERHKTTLAVLYEGQVKLDRLAAQVRHYPSARAMAMFPYNMPETVYDQLVGSVHAGLPTLHKYYDLRRRSLGLSELRHYDVRVPLVKGVSWHHTFEQAIDVVLRALAPLGPEYTETLGQGLRGRWVDRYENKGKTSGAFSYGSFTGAPYILMNFKEELLDDVFTLAHEAGHSMHSMESARNNPFLHWHYTTFEAEVASTVNEQLLLRHLIATARTADEKAYLVNKEIDSIIGSLFRQTMFAEFEARTHSLAEAGTPLTIDVLRQEYRTLLGTYFGPTLALEEVSDLEGLRIPHFYRAFYVYTYATGIAAAIAIAGRIINLGEPARKDYFTFLRSGGSRFPIDALRLAGVDMASPAPVNAAIARFATLVDELGTILT